MKIHILLVLLLVSCNQQIKDKKNTFESIDLSKFAGKEVKDLLNEPLFKDYVRYQLITEFDAFYLDGISFIYPDDTFVEVYFNLKYQERYQPEREWNFDLLTKEQISTISILKDEGVKTKQLNDTHF